MALTNPLTGNSTTGQSDSSEVAQCDKCKCTWFEQFQARQYRTNYTTVLGQMPPYYGDFTFVFLRCLKCGEKFQPNVLPGPQDREAKVYDKLLNQLEEKLPETK